MITINPVIKKLMAFKLVAVGNISVSGVVDKPQFDKLCNWCRTHLVTLWELKQQGGI